MSRPAAVARIFHHTIARRTIGLILHAGAPRGCPTTFPQSPPPQSSWHERRQNRPTPLPPPCRSKPRPQVPRRCQRPSSRPTRRAPRFGPSKPIEAHLSPTSRSPWPTYPPWPPQKRPPERAGVRPRVASVPTQTAATPATKPLANTCRAFRGPSFVPASRPPRLSRVRRLPDTKNSIRMTAPCHPAKAKTEPPTSVAATEPSVVSQPSLHPP